MEMTPIITPAVSPRLANLSTGAFGRACTWHAPKRATKQVVTTGDVPGVPSLEPDC